MKTKTTSLTVVIIFISAAITLAHTSYTGRSGSPGRDRCAASCHGSSGGSITIDGFPDEYIPGETYVITIGHSSGNSIRQFNASCRVGTGTQNAGTISAGSGTATYNTSGETNGVHFTSSNQNSGSFIWTAPESGTGEVRLYVAGLQGSYGGQNSTLTFISNELTTDINDRGLTDMPSLFFLDGNYPNPFNASTTISYGLNVDSQVSIEIFDILGNRTAVLFDGVQPAGSHTITWNSANSPSGIYYCRIQAGGQTVHSKMTLLK